MSKSGGQAMLELQNLLRPTRLIEYRHIRIIAPMADIESSLSYLKERDETARKKIMTSVNANLVSSYPEVINKTASQAALLAFGQDVAIWFANEVDAGRAKLQITMH
jgi:hypothetical protein